MRAITATQIAAFGGLLCTILAAAGAGTAVAAGALPAGEYRALTVVAIFVLLFYLSAFLVYRMFLWFRPLQEGALQDGSRGEFSAQVNILFYLLIFNTLVRSHVIPVPLMRLVYQALGAKLGKNTYSAGAILDPALFVAGDDCIVGHDAVIFSHAIEGRHFSLSIVRFGNGVTIGAHAVVMSDVVIGNGAIVSAGAVVVKGTRIAAGEVWGGVPARRLRAADPSS